MCLKLSFCAKIDLYEQNSLQRLIIWIQVTMLPVPILLTDYFIQVLIIYLCMDHFIDQLVS